MIEIIAIFYFSQKVGNKAKDKGYIKRWHVFLFVLLWVIGEFLGAVIGHLNTNGVIVYLFAIIGAGIGGLLSYLIVNLLKDKSKNEDLKSASTK